jgi:DNA-binding MarR family transcriptional regulator
MHAHKLRVHKMITHLMQAHGIMGVAMGTTRESVLLNEWRDLAERHARVSGALERALHEAHGLGVSEFEVLDHLVSAEQCSCRIQELTGSLHLSQSALSRVVARLETDGLVARTICEDDRRGIFACLTEAGRARHAEARPTHREILQQTLAG